MIFTEQLIPGTLVRRYKRFLADVILETGETITVYCPNTGSMQSCSAPGSQVLLSLSDNLKRKYRHTLEMVRSGKTWVGINTGLTNGIVADGFKDGKITEVGMVDSLKTEVKTSSHTRLDLLLTQGEQKIYVEIKNCSLVEDGIAMFPDAVTERGTKHLLELADLVSRGHRGMIFYLVQRMDAESFRAAAHIDPLYAGTLQKVVGDGVEILAYRAKLGPEGIELDCPLPCSID